MKRRHHTRKDRALFVAELNVLGLPIDHRYKARKMCPYVGRRTRAQRQAYWSAVISDGKRSRLARNEYLGWVRGVGAMRATAGKERG